MFDWERNLRWINARFVNRPDYLNIWNFAGSYYDRFHRKHFDKLHPDGIMAKVAKGDEIAAPPASGPGPNGTSVSLYLALDWDNKDKDPTIAERNDREAREVAERAKEFQAMIIASNPWGGRHLLIFFKEPQPTERVIALGAQLAGAQCVEIMPRNSHDQYPRMLTAIRIPGPYKDRKSVAAVWDWKTDRWVDWGTDEYLDVVEQYQGVSGDLLPNVEAWPIVSLSGEGGPAPRASSDGGCSDWKRDEGPKMWARMYRKALEKPSTQDFSVYVDIEQKKINCPECSLHFAKKRAEYPLPSDPNKLFDWVYDRHSEIRADQNKEVWDIEKARAHWLQTDDPSK